MSRFAGRTCAFSASTSTTSTPPGLKPQVHRRQIRVGPDQESADDHQHDRERDLTDDEAARKAEVRPGDVSCLLQRFNRRDPRGATRRKKAEQHRQRQSRSRP